MTRQHVVALGAVAAIATLAACQGDRAVAPAATGTPTAVRATETAPTNNKLGTDTLVVTFKVQPNRAVSQALAGGHKIYFSTGSICDPDTSGYGAGTWETPCVPAKRAVTITATSWVDAEGHPFVEFSPALRFNPDDEKPVSLLMIDKHGARDPNGTILYCPDVQDTSTCVDESVTDPELATVRDAKKGYLYRRVKHFSGYNVAVGWASAETY